MKRMFLAVVLGVAAFAVWTKPAVAGCGLFHWCSPCKKCGADFCIRQYNAFSPVCHGTVYCDGIHPFAGPGYPGAVSPWPTGGHGGCPTCYGGMMAPMGVIGQMPMPAGNPNPAMIPPAGQPGFPPQPGTAPPAANQPSHLNFPPRPMPAASMGNPGWMMPVGYYTYPGYMPMMPYMGQ